MKSGSEVTIDHTTLGYPLLSLADVPVADAFEDDDWGFFV